MHVRARHLLLGVLSAIFAGWCVWWTLHVPDHPEWIWRVAPSDAPFVSAHARLAERWDELQSNPLFRSARDAVPGLDALDWDALSRQPEFRRWLKRLAGTDTALVALPGADRPIWCFASWIGPQSVRLRAELRLSRIPGLRAVGAPHGGRRLWRWQPAAGGPGVSFAIEEGMLIGCLSDRHGDLRLALDVYDGRYGPTLGMLPAAARDFGAGPDRGRWNGHDARGRRRRLTFDFSELGARRTRGRLAAHWPGFSPSATNGARAIWSGRTAGAVLPAPAVSLTLRAADAAAWLERHTPDVWTAGLQRALREPAAAAEPVTLALYGDPYSGRAGGLKAPGLALAFPAGETNAVMAALTTELDRLNARFRLGLVPHPLPAGPHALTAIEGTGANLYAKLLPNECPALLLRDGWALLAASATTLQALSAVPAGSFAPWEDQPLAPGMARLRVDTRPAARTLRDAIFLYTLMSRTGAAAAPRFRSSLIAAADALNRLFAEGRIEADFCWSGDDLRVDADWHHPAEEK